MAKSTLTVKDRSRIIQNERLWHEQEAHRRRPLNALLYDPPAFDEVVGSALDFLAGKAGEFVLDTGCGEGKVTLRLAQQKLYVVSMDLSHKQLAQARERIQVHAPEAQVHFVQANAEEPPFADNSFRIIYGKAILHHLDLDLTAEIIHKLLQANGRVSFAEPLDRHPLFWLGRALTPKLRTKDEHPMPLHELEAFARQFKGYEMKTYFLLAPLAFGLRPFPGGENLFRATYSFLSKIDAFLFSRLGWLQKFAWYGIVNIQK